MPQLHYFHSNSSLFRFLYGLIRFIFLSPMTLKYISYRAPNSFSQCHQHRTTYCVNISFVPLNEKLAQVLYARILHGFKAIIWSVLSVKVALHVHYSHILSILVFLTCFVRYVQNRAEKGYKKVNFRKQELRDAQRAAATCTAVAAKSPEGSDSLQRSLGPCHRPLGKRSARQLS